MTSRAAADTADPGLTAIVMEPSDRSRSGACTETYGKINAGTHPVSLVRDGQSDWNVALVRTPRGASFRVVVRSRENVRIDGLELLTG